MATSSKGRLMWAASCSSFRVGFGGACSLVLLYLSGLAGFQAVWLAAFMVPPALLGTWLGRRQKGRFDKRYRPALLAIAVMASCLLILKGLSG